MIPSFSAKIVYSFCCLPARRLFNEVQDIKYTGIKQRRYGYEYESSSDLAYKACAPMLVSSRGSTAGSSFLGPAVKPRDDCAGVKFNSLIFASTSPDVPSPASAHFLHKKLSLPDHMHCFDVASSCSSFLSALRASCAFLSPENINLIVSAELKHKSIDDNDSRTASLFSDGAGGVVLQKDLKYARLTFFYQKTESQYVENIIIPVGGSRTPVSSENICQNKLKINLPKKMFLVIVENIVEAIKSSLSIINTNKNYLFFIHQANKNILKEVKKRLSKNISYKIPTLMTDIGNMVSASLPVLRCRIYLLRALFYEFQEDLCTHNLVNLFQHVCRKNNKFKYYIWNTGIVFEFEFFKEIFFIFDDGITRLEQSWLSDCVQEELNILNKIFQQELQNKSKQFQDILIAAGGGFQTIAAIYEYPETFIDTTHGG